MMARRNPLLGFIFLIGLVAYLFLAKIAPIQASAEFITNYDVTYEVTPQGKVLVSQAVSLTNKLSNLYATQYSFSIERSQPQNITASDELGPLKVTTQTQGETTTINLEFNQQVVGKNKTLKFNLAYEAPELINKSGQIWEIVIPKIASPDEIDNYQLTLKVPLAFGQTAYASPAPNSKTFTDNQQLFFFGQEQAAAGIGVAFGEFQIFDFSLSYYLANPAGSSAMAKIAFPPDTAYQKMAYDSISPQPENMEVDNDGNWLGVYQLKPKQTLEIIAQGQAKILNQPQQADLSYTPEQLEKYLQPQPYWPVDNPEIVAQAKQFKTPRAIYDFVVKTLGYDYSRVREGVKRLGADGALKNPERAICMEYTDLFIALARAAGIPARGIDGYAYTDNPQLKPLSLAQDILHAWPEYWDEDQKLWRQIDPTWGDTTGGRDYFSQLDFDHFAFVIHGENSQSPLSAGSYRQEGVSQKNIQITFGQYKEASPALLKLDFLIPDKIATEMPTEGKIRVINPGPEAISNLEIQIVVQNFKLLTNNKASFNILPPFAYREIPVKITNKNVFSPSSGKIIVSANKQKFEHVLTSQSLILTKVLPLMGILLLIGVLFFVLKRFGKLSFIQKIFKKKG